MNESATSLVERLRAWDEKRPSLPGEHWLTGAVGLWLLLRPARGVAGRLLSAGAGALLLTRAITGRDGAIAALRRTAHEEADEPEFVDVAAPYPYDHRTRVGTPRRVRQGIEAAPAVAERAAVSDPA